ncbi:MAG: hypothetical protein GWN00_01185 [Aliifodinibius sp.]|nr:hypothetical protein [Fodinibius sp.]NIV09945.1 hypothetical protein [Fodinibius sp.]NIY23475.1 hypothetical protein [Fodinibius sp.]
MTLSRSEQVIREYLDSGYTFALPEAGGMSALAVYLYVKDVIPKDRLFAADKNDKRLLQWAAIGVETDTDILHSLDLTKTVLLPCSEYEIHRYPEFVKRLGHGDSAVIHHKRKSHELISENARIVRVPRIVNFDTIIRPVAGSGSKGVSFQDSTVIITEYLPGVEYEVDFNTVDETIHPMLIHWRDNGAMGFKEFVGTRYEYYTDIQEATWDVIQALGMSGIGSIQFMFYKGEFYYIEACVRIHGSSRFQWIGGNPVLGYHGDLDFDTKPVIMLAGGLL